MTRAACHCYIHTFAPAIKENLVRNVRSALVLTILISTICIGLHAAPAAPRVTIALDASDAPRKIFHAQLTIPAAPGTLTLYYPKWIPGEHAPSGPVLNLAGLRFTG